MLKKLLIINNVKILYGTVATSAIKEGNSLKAVICENKSGRFAIEAKSFVDASGDADIARFCNLECEYFKQGNVLAAWYYTASENGYLRKCLGACDIPDAEKENGSKIELLSNKRYGGISGDELSQMVIDSHNSFLNDWEKNKKADLPVLQNIKRFVIIYNKRPPVMAVLFYFTLFCLMGYWNKLTISKFDLSKFWTSREICFT